MASDGIADATDIFDEGELAVDEIESARARRWTSQVVVVAAAVLLFLNARSIQSWAYTLEPSWGAETVRALADTWAARTEVAGLDRLRDDVRARYEAAKGWRWPGSKARREPGRPPA